MKAFQTSKFAVPAGDLKKAVAWWNQFDSKKQTKLQKDHDLQTYLDLIAFWQEQTGGA